MSKSTTKKETMNIFKIDDAEYWIAPSLDCAIQAYNDCHAIPTEDDVTKHARELSKTELNTLQFWDSEDTDPDNPDHYRCPCGSPVTENCFKDAINGGYKHRHGKNNVIMNNIVKRTFQEELDQRNFTGKSIPSLFASNEH